MIGNHLLDATRASAPPRARRPRASVPRFPMALLLLVRSVMSHAYTQHNAQSMVVRGGYSHVLPGPFLTHPATVFAAQQRYTLAQGMGPAWRLRSRLARPRFSVDRLVPSLSDAGRESQPLPRKHPYSILTSEKATIGWCEPYFPDSVHSQLPAFRACSASNSIGGRYPRLERNFL
jgi:hypothetical protein